MLPATGLILELASGSGEHVVYFAGEFPKTVWQPTDIKQDALASIDSHRTAESAPNVLPSLYLDVNTSIWPVAKVEAVVCINMLHITPWVSCVALLNGVAKILHTGGFLILYGPFKQHGRHTAQTNAIFDISLTRENAQWGIRDIEEIGNTAEKAGLELADQINMPSNNFCLILKRT